VGALQLRKTRKLSQAGEHYHNGETVHGVYCYHRDIDRVKRVYDANVNEQEAKQRQLSKDNGATECLQEGFQYTATWWNPGRPPDSTGLSVGSTAMSCTSGFWSVRYVPAPCMVPPVPTPALGSLNVAF